MTNAPEGGADRQLSRIWQTIDFRSAPSGWTVIALYDEGRSVYPVAGWLIQEAVLFDDEVDRITPVQEDEPDKRRVVPGICDGTSGWTVQPVDEGNDNDPYTWKILAPGEPGPSEQDEVDERERRAELTKRSRG